MINLNSEEFNDKPVVKIFNNGEAGLVRNVRGVKIERKSDDSNQPDFKLYWEDKDGNQINKGLYHYKDGDNASKYGITLKDLVKVYLGESALATIPTFPTMRETTDWVINQIEPLFNQVVVKLTVNYGHGTKPKAFLQVRGYHPFIEAESCANPNPKMNLTSYDITTRLTADQPVMNGSTANSSVI